MYGGCALSMERSEVPPKAAADSRVGRAGGLALRALLAADGVGAVAPVASGFASSLVAPPPLWMLRPATRAAPSSGTAHSLATAMPGAAVDAGCGSVYGAVGPELRFGAAELGRRRISRPPDASVSRGGGVWERLRCGCRWHRECCGWRAAMRAAPGLRALGRFVDAGWQDLRAVHDSRGPCSEKCPFLVRSSRGVSSDGGLRGVSDAWRAYLAKASPFSDAWRANLAANWRFSRPRPLSGCMERKTCHGLPPGDAFREHFAIVERLGTHQGIILPRPDARAERSARPCATTPCATMPCAAAPQRPAHALRARRSCPRAARHSATMPCTVRGAFVAAEKVSCGLRVSMR